MKDGNLWRGMEGEGLRAEKKDWRVKELMKVNEGAVFQ